MVGKMFKFLASKHQQNFLSRLKKYNRRLYILLVFWPYFSFNILNVWRGKGWTISACLDPSFHFSYKQWKYFMQLIFNFPISLKMLARRLLLHSVTRPSFIFVFWTHVNTLLNHGDIIKLLKLYHKFTFGILVVNATVVILAAVIADRRTFHISSVRLDFC